MILHIRIFFAELRSIIATLFSFITMNLIAAIFFIGTFIILSLGINKTNEIEYFKYLLVAFYLIFLNPAILFSSLVFTIKFIKIKNPYSFSICTALVATLFIGLIGFLFAPGYTVLEIARNFTAISCLFIVWTVLFHSKLNFEKTLSYGYFVYALINSLFFNFKQHINEGKPEWIKLVIGIIGAVIGSAIISKLFEVIIKANFKLFKVQILNKQKLDNVD